METKKERPWTNPVFLRFALVGLVLAAYSVALGGEFVWDDVMLIVDQPQIHEFQGFGSYFQKMLWHDPLATSDRSFYRPIVTLSYVLDWQLGGGAPFVFHLTNLIAHVVAVLLLFQLALRVGASAVPAAVCAALWALQPRLAESVAWISGRTDVFAGVGVLAAFVLWSSESRAHLRRSLSALALLGGLLSKEVAVAGGLGLLAWEWMEQRRHPVGWGRWMLRLAPLGLVAAMYALLRSGAIRKDLEPLPRGLGEHLALVLEAIGRYPLMVVDVFRPRLHIGVNGIADPLLVGTGVVFLLLALVLLVFFVRRPPASILVGVAVMGAVGIGLVLHVIRLQVDVVACDRFLYVPTMSLAVLGAGWLSQESRRARMGLVAAALLVLPLAWSTSVRAAEWASPLKLWAKGLKTAPALHHGSYEGLADTLSSLGLDEAALAQYLKSAELYPELARRFETKHLRQVPLPIANWLNQAVTLQMLGRYEEAVSLFELIEANEPTRRRARLARVRLELRRLQPEAAERELERVVRELGEDEFTSRIRSESEHVREVKRTLPSLSSTQRLEAEARLFDELGARHETSRRWSELVSHPDASPQQVIDALGWMSFNASPAAALEVLQQGERRLGAQTEPLPLLRAHVDERVKALVDVFGSDAPMR